MNAVTGSWGIRIPTEEDRETQRPPPLPLHTSHREAGTLQLLHRLRTEEDAVQDTVRRHVLVEEGQICLLSWGLLPLHDGDGNRILAAVRSYMVPWNDAAIPAPWLNLPPHHS
jgi:hypothetical protein